MYIVPQHIKLDHQALQRTGVGSHMASIMRPEGLNRQRRQRVLAKPRPFVIT